MLLTNVMGGGIEVSPTFLIGAAEGYSVVGVVGRRVLLLDPGFHSSPPFGGKASLTCPSP